MKDFKGIVNCRYLVNLVSLMRDNFDSKWFLAVYL